MHITGRWHETGSPALVPVQESSREVFSSAPFCGVLMQEHLVVRWLTLNVKEMSAS